MSIRKFCLALAVISLVPGVISESHAQRRTTTQTAKAPAQPKLPAKVSRKAVSQLRSVRNKLAGAEKLSRQKYANASRTVQQARDAERGLADSGISERSVAFRRAKARRLNAESTASDFRAEYLEAQRQTRAANRTLSFAKRGDWISAHASVGAKNPIAPKPRLRKISFNTSTLGPTPNGTGNRKGILKTRTDRR